MSYDKREQPDGLLVVRIAGLFHTDEADLMSRIIEGSYVNDRQVIPTTGQA